LTYGGPGRRVALAFPSPASAFGGGARLVSTAAAAIAAGDEQHLDR
jgi:hypothetical protein